MPGQYPEVFSFDSSTDRVRPGRDWVDAISAIRSVSSLPARNQQFSHLGTALAGAVHVNQGAEANLDDFASAAEPPLDRIESNLLNSHYHFMNYILTQQFVEGVANV